MTRPSAPDRTPWFVHDRFGMFIHWGLYSLAARHEWVKNKERLTDGQYQRYFDHFHPDLYDPKTWARAAKNAGMKYVVITTKHHEGFCLWDSKHTDYKATKTPWGKDLLSPMVEAFRDEGLRVGFYHSLIDWHHPQYPVDKYHPQRDDKAFRAKTRNRDVRTYAEYLHAQVRELLTEFGQIDILWFDFSFPGKDGKGRADWQSEKLLEMVRKLQPDVLIDNRLDLPGSGDFVTPEQFQPYAGPKDKNGKTAVWEACQTFSGSWGYHRDEQTWKSIPQLLTMLIDGVSKGGNLLLNVGPTARGEFDDRAMSRLEDIGRWMRRHSRAIYGCGPSRFVHPPDCRYTQNGKRLYLHVLNWPFEILYCPGLAGKVEYAQLLHDGSEARMKGLEDWQATSSLGRPPADMLAIKLPVVKPDVDVPVVEIFLK
ncbi:MAG: alpha-L-fucosidase [Planctomycetota bacterium]